MLFKFSAFQPVRRRCASEVETFVQARASA
jgi:hypothetical protein